MKKLTILVTAFCLTVLTACSTNQANSSQSAQPSQSAGAPPGGLQRPCLLRRC